MVQIKTIKKNKWPGVLIWQSCKCKSVLNCVANMRSLMRRFSPRRPHIAGKPQTDHAAKRHLLRLGNLIFTLEANPTPGVCASACRGTDECVPAAFHWWWTPTDLCKARWILGLKLGLTAALSHPCFCQRLYIQTRSTVNLFTVCSHPVKATESTSVLFIEWDYN